MQNPTSIAIGDITIHQSANGLYLLTDLWKASGSSSANRPKNWLKLESTKNYLSYLSSKDDVPNSAPLNNSRYFEVVIGKGKAQGTFVSKPLVYSYAMWISPRFHDLVIETFDKIMNANTVNELIAVKEFSESGQMSLISKWQEPRDQNTLGVHLKTATSKLKPYFDHLCAIGELTREWIEQPAKAVYHATETSKHIIGRKGNTVLFDDGVVELFPAQIDWCDYE